MEKEVVQLLDDAAGMQLSLSEDDSDYDLNFIREKVTKVAVYQERLSDIQMKLTKLNIDVTKMSSQTQEQLKMKERELRLGEDYQGKKIQEKKAWLGEQLAPQFQAAENWSNLSRLVSEVKEAVGHRVSMMKRLDSDLRLHSKLFEEGVKAGATSPTSFTKGSTKEIDLA